MLEIYFLTLLGVMAAQAAPGPNLIAVASVSLSQGRKAGLGVVAGVASGMLVWSFVTFYGLGQLLVTFPWTMMVMRLGKGFVDNFRLMWLSQWKQSILYYDQVLRTWIPALYIESTGWS